MRRSMVILTSVMATGALTLTACGSRDDKGGDSDNGGGTTLTIGVDAPLSGENSTTGLGIQYGAQIAVDDANKNKLVPGVTFKLKAYDDKAQLLPPASPTPPPSPATRPPSAPSAR